MKRKTKLKIAEQSSLLSEIILFVVLAIVFLIPILCDFAKAQKEKEENIQLTKEKKENTPLTKEKLKKYRGLENITDAEAENILVTFRKYSELTYKLFQAEKMNNKFC